MNAMSRHFAIGWITHFLIVPALQMRLPRPSFAADAGPWARLGIGILALALLLAAEGA
jgi:hypothetical protein